MPHEILAIIPTINVLFNLFKTAIEKRHERFENLVSDFLRPTNAAFNGVNDAYRNLFHSFADSLPYLSGTTWHVPNSSEVFGIPFDDPKVRTVTDEAVTTFLANRAKFEDARNDVRKLAQNVLNASNDTDYKRYMVSVFLYFLDTTGSSFDDSALDRYANAIVTKGGEAGLDTPSERLWKLLHAARSPLEMTHIAHAFLQILSTRYSESQSLYWRIERRLLPGA